MRLFNSLKSRLLISALLVVMIVLPLVGLTLNNAFESQLQKAIQNELTAHSYAILAVVDVEDSELILPEALIENRFNVIQSGLYAIATQTNTEEMLWSSPSFINDNFPNVLHTPTLGESLYQELVLDKVNHLVYSISVNLNTDFGTFPFTLHILLDKSDFNEVAEQFSQQLWIWLAILMVVLLIIQWVWLSWTIKPLNVLQKEVSAVEQGEKLKLQETYPSELNQVTDQLNSLLATEQNQRQRYRNALSDLAHSLKTPLAVIQSQQDLSSGSLEQVQSINQIVEYQLKKAQSAGESSWHLGFEILPVVTKLVNSLNKIYRDKALSIHIEVPEQLIFKGDESDFMELMGNLLDNACKAAANNVLLKVEKKDCHLYLYVEDDGCGIDDSQKQKILQRGSRADTYSSGHGIGLAIVKNLVESYQGKLTIEQSEQLGGAKFVLKFAQ